MNLRFCIKVFITLKFLALIPITRERTNRKKLRLCFAEQLIFHFQGPCFFCKIAFHNLANKKHSGKNIQRYFYCCIFFHPNLQIVTMYSFCDFIVKYLCFLFEYLFSLAGMKKLVNPLQNLIQSISNFKLFIQYKQNFISGQVLELFFTNKCFFCLL